MTKAFDGADDIKVTELPDGGAIVEIDGEVIQYSPEEVAEMEADVRSIIEGGDAHHGQADAEAAV